MANEIKRLHSPQIIEKDVGDATERRVKLRALEACVPMLTIAFYSCAKR
jgi:hypothetical protein